MMLHILISILAILLTSCAGENVDHYTQNVASWRGADVSKLTARFGSPDRLVKGADGSRVYVYKTASYRTVPESISPQLDVLLGERENPVIIKLPNTNTTWMRGRTHLSCLAAFKADKRGTIIGTNAYGVACYNVAKSRQRV